MAELIGEYLSTMQAGQAAGLSQKQIGYLLRQGTLQGSKLGRDWLVYRPSLAAYMANRPRPGLKLGQKITRPRKIAHA
jgi:hypothetical protein